nr:oryzain alpha chain-like [Aegilops tauschii subsp. strangulata]
MRSFTTSLVAALLLLSARAALAEPSTPTPGPTVYDDNCTTCCCIYRQGDDCFTWTCCPLQGTTCCDDSYSRCPHDYGFCDTNLGTCLMGQDSLLSVKALKRTMAKPHRAFSSGSKTTMSEYTQELDHRRRALLRPFILMLQC